MATSTFTFKDQFGNPVWGLATRIARGRGDTTKAEDERYPDKAGHTSFIEVKMTLPSPAPPTYPDSGHTLHVNYNEGLNPDWRNYTPLSKYFTDIEDGSAISVPIIVQYGGAVNPPEPITGFGTCSEWQKAVKAIFDKHGFIGAGPDNEGQGSNQAPNLRATIGEIKALYSGPHSSYLQWQFESTGNPLELRPRLFLPHGGSDQFERYADIGDWMSTFKWEHCV